MQNLDKRSPHFSVRFADGSRMWLNTDSPAETLLDPVFLKFVAICILIGAVLDPGGADACSMQPQQVAFLWLVTGIELMIWLCGVFYLIRLLYNRGLLSSIYSPVVVMPFLLVSETTTYLIVYGIDSLYSPTLEVLFSEVLRAVLLLLTYDVMFSSFVVNKHSAFSSVPVVLNQPALPPSASPPKEGDDKKDAADAPSETAEPPVAPILSATAAIAALPDLPAPSPLAPEIKLGSKVFSVDEIEMIRSEDHYLAIFTANRKDLVRARMSDSVAKLDIRYGVQVNRSTWVAFAIVEKLVKTETVFEAHLKDGSVETVAAVRRHAVNAAYQLFLSQTKKR